MKATFWDCVRAAFSARPIGMFVPPNWVGLALFGLLGLLNPGFWLVGAGLELGYLYLLASNKRFQRYVAAVKAAPPREAMQRRVSDALRALSVGNRMRYFKLETRCRQVLEPLLRAGATPSGLSAQSEGLNRLLWMYLRLLLMRQTVQQIVEAADPERGERRDLEKRARGLEAQLTAKDLADDLRRSLTGQLDILKQRLLKQDEAKQKLAYLDAELARVEQQVELIREQAMLAADPQGVSDRIDQVAATLDGTNQWISQQQQLLGTAEDLLSEPPPLLSSPPPQAEQA